MTHKLAGVYMMDRYRILSAEAAAIQEEIHCFVALLSYQCGTTEPVTIPANEILKAATCQE